LRVWKKRHELPRWKGRLLPELFERAILEARRHTDAIFGLPEGEEVTFGALKGQPFLALAEYRGGLRSRVLVNTDRPFNVADLLYVACHEGYPGHIAEIVLKETRLVEEKGYVEELVSFLPTPRFVVSEGLARWDRAVDTPWPRGGAADVVVLTAAVRGGLRLLLPPRQETPRVRDAWS
jgi:hypothetical protein